MRPSHMTSRVWIRCATFVLAGALLLGCRPASRDPAPLETPPRAAAPSLLASYGTRPGLVLLALHDNENDAVVAARGFVDTHGGRLVEVRAQGARHVSLLRDGRRTSFDPNRVFTDAGLRRTLADRGSALDAPSIAIARLFADDVLRAINTDTTPLLVAVHNNTDGAYSASSYAPGGELARDAAALHLPRGVDPDHFFLVTTRALYDALRPSGYPVVLQDNARATDDGSLSILCARRGIAYVNVEAEHGRADVQRAMLDALHRALAPASATTRR